MPKFALRRLLALSATAGLAATLAACGPDDSQQSRTLAPLLSPSAAQPGWSMADLAGVDPAFLGRDAAPLPQAVPMRASYRGSYDYAPAYDYGPERYYDDGYYADDAGPDDYQWLALAAALGGMLGNAPPDYGFGYDGVEPWAWETGDRYLRYAEPVYGGYRYYYYEPDSYTPYLVSDPYYSYGYRDDRLVAIYDRSGRVIDARRAARQRQAAQDYFARARQMYLAGHRQPRLGVPASLWDNHRDEIARAQRQWTRARQERPAWRQWDTRNEPRLHRDWSGEALVRREAERSFAGWQKADFKTPAPKFYSPQQRQAQLQKVAAIRRDEQLVGQHRAAQQQAVAGQRRPQRLASAERAREHVAQAQRQQAQAREAALQRQQARQRQADAQLAYTRQQQHTQQQRAQAERAGVQRQAQAQKAQQQARAAAVTRQRAAREHQLEAQRGQQARVAQQHKQARQARAAEQQRQAQQARAAERQQARQAHAAQQRQAQQARAAQQQRQAQARQAVQRQAQQQRVAQQQRQAQQAHAAQQAQQARAAQQRSAPRQAGQQSGGHGDHGRGHDRG
jgi:hypothetical protein